MNFRDKVFRIGKLLCIVAIALVGILCYRSWSNSRAEQRNLQAVLDAQLLPLTRRQQELELDLRNLERSRMELPAVLTDVSTVQIVAPEPGEWVEQTLWPKLEDADMVGILGIHGSAMPGMDAMLGVDQVNALTNQGWQLIYSFDSDALTNSLNVAEKALIEWERRYTAQYGTTNRAVTNMEKERSIQEETLVTTVFREWKQEVQETASELGLQLADVIYFPEGIYRSEYDACLLNAGFKVVLRYGSLDQTAITEPLDGPISLLGVMAWGEANQDVQLERLTEAGGNLVLTVSNPEAILASRYDQSQYKEESFSELLQKLAQYRQSDILEVCTFDQIRSIQKRTPINLADREKEREIQIVEEELRRVEAQIESIYAQYGIGQGAASPGT